MLQSEPIYKRRLEVLWRELMRFGDKLPAEVVIAFNHYSWRNAVVCLPTREWAAYRRWMKSHPLLTEFYRGGKGRTSQP